jgi:two-component system NtrC family sensor kinase
MAVFLSRKMVAQIRKSDQEKEMMNEQIIEAGKLASLGELAAGIAHEINNPVAIMVEEAGWMGDILEEEEFRSSENFKEYQRALTQIRNQGIRCKEITHKMLSFARKIDSPFQEVQLNTLIEEVVGLSEKKARYANVEIVNHLSPDLPSVHVSPSEMQQVFLNMINNAVDAIDSKKGGTITLTTRMENGMIVIDIGDTGSGIAQANLQRIFDPFFTTKAVGRGTGLGLSICYGIIKKIGGDITVNSAVGKGTVFHIRIPVIRPGTT